MSVASVGGSLSPWNKVNTPPPKPQTGGTSNTASVKPKDADGDHDGDTAASDRGGLDVKG